MKTTIVDSGFLVALGIKRDPRHDAARQFLETYRGELLVPAPVVSEACYFFSVQTKVRMLDWLLDPARHVLDIPITAYPEIGTILSRYASLDPDFTDAAIVWLAQATGCRTVLTVDSRDFTVFRLRGNRRFQLVRWFE